MHKLTVESFGFSWNDAFKALAIPEGYTLLKAGSRHNSVSLEPNFERTEWQKPPCDGCNVGTNVPYLRKLKKDEELKFGEIFACGHGPKIGESCAICEEQNIALIPVGPLFKNLFPKVKKVKKAA